MSEGGKKMHQLQDPIKLYKEAKENAIDKDDDSWVITEDHDNDNSTMESSTSSLEDSRISSGSTSPSDMVDDASSYCLSSHSSGPLYELSELMAQLPIK
jgi:hypothetical protein|uniref:Uncharacterized protein n=1 Tax=Fagus sylvatica TaxID=28930 RepID=A0A2N9GRA7_FAGSY